MSNSSKSLITHRTEQQMVSELADFLRSENYRVRLEVPNLGQSVDVVATRGRWVTLIEVKLSNWRRAIKQCEAHEHVADFVCIAVGTKRISDTASREIKKLGYGLIHHMGNGNFRWIIRPKRNNSVWLPQRRKLASAFGDIDYVS